MSKLRRGRGTWLPRIDDKPVRFARKIMSKDRMLRPLLTMTTEPVSAGRLLESGIGYVDYQLEFLGFVIRERTDEGVIVLRLSDKGVAVGEAIMQFLETIRDNLPETKVHGKTFGENK